MYLIGEFLVVSSRDVNYNMQSCSATFVYENSCHFAFLPGLVSASSSDSVSSSFTSVTTGGTVADGTDAGGAEAGT